MKRLLLILFILLVNAVPSRGQIYLVRAFTNLSFPAPIDLQDPDDGRDRLYVVQQGGFIRCFDNDSLTTDSDLFLDLSDSVFFASESGLVGMAFHPDYTTNRKFYVSYITPPPSRHVIAQYLRSVTNPDSADASTHLTIFEYSVATPNHHAGQLAFDTTGALVISIGEDLDHEAAQDPSNVLGTLIRIDVDNPEVGKNYGIPPDNPFVGNAMGYLEEVYAFGFRNPWRFSIDDMNRYWVGDVGSNVSEEINLVEAGGNYGWPRMEGTNCFLPFVCDTAGLDLKLPYYEYPHGGLAAVVSGYIYNGTQIPDFDDQFIFADFATGRIWALDLDGINPPTDSLLIDSPYLVTAMGTDRNGDLFILTTKGTIYELKAYDPPSSVSPTPRTSLGQLLGNYPNPFNPSTTIRYEVNVAGRATLRVFDVKGRILFSTSRYHTAPGRYETPWNGQVQGSTAASGLYFYDLSIDGKRVDSRRMVLLK